MGYKDTLCGIIAPFAFCDMWHSFPFKLVVTAAGGGGRGSAAGGGGGGGAVSCCLLSFTQSLRAFGQRYRLLTCIFKN